MLVELFIAAVVIIFAYFKRTYQYWKNRKVPYVEPTIPFGNTGNPYTRPTTLSVRFRDVYNELKSKGLKHGGFYVMASPFYMPVDLEYIKNMLTRDFQYFTDRGLYYDEEDEPISAHLLAIEGEKWRKLRIKLTPTFTPGKMKMMFKTLVECAGPLKEVMDDVVDSGQPIDIKDVLGRFTTDVIASCAFGLECNSIKDENSQFRQNGKLVFNYSKLRYASSAIAMVFPKISRAFGYKSVPQAIAGFFMNMVKEMVAHREKNNVVRKDFMQILIKLKNSQLEPGAEGADKHDGKRLTVEDIGAQCFVFFLAGYETSSTVMTFALLEMARNPDIQEKARNEVLTVMEKHNNELTYDALNELKYLGQVMDEAMRLYPPAATLLRQCVKDYKIPDTDIVIEKGTKCCVSVLGIHMDPEFYDQPEIFDPDRFSDEAKNQRHPYTFLPFGEGPRNCIGLRFGLMQSKFGLCVLLKHFRFTVDKKTKLPITFLKGGFVSTAEGGVWLRAERLKT